MINQAELITLLTNANPKQRDAIAKQLGVDAETLARLEAIQRYRELNPTPAIQLPNK